MSQKECEEKLKKCLGGQYDKNDPKIYDLLASKQPTAIDNAKRLLEGCDLLSLTLIQCNPSTTVHELVAELNQHRRP